MKNEELFVQIKNSKMSAVNICKKLSKSGWNYCSTALQDCVVISVYSAAVIVVMDSGKINVLEVL